MGYKGAAVDMIWVDELSDPWGPTGRYGKVIEQATHDLRLYGNAFIKFDIEGEKPMAEIDWKKPLRVYPPGERNKHQKVYTFKSGKQRVVWIDDHVYPVDDNGRATATVSYPNTVAVKNGEKVVENVPEEKFFLGLYRHYGTSNYLLEGGGIPKTRHQVQLIECPDQWVVDTRKSAEPPKAIEHDPKDYVTIYARGGDTFTSPMMTKAKAEACVSEPGEQVVRVRTTPAPVDTARYICLWREDASRPWKVNKFGDGRQEFTWAELGCRVGRPDYCIVKVRD